MTRKFGKHLHVTCGTTGQLIKYHHQSITWSSPLEIEPATTECRAESLPLSAQVFAELSSHGNLIYSKFPVQGEILKKYVP